MFGKSLVRNMISRSAESETDRRRFLKAAGVAGLGVVGAGAMGTFGAGSAAAADAPSDGAVLNFALNLEYLEAEFYHFAVYGTSIPDALTNGTGTKGGVTGGHAVPWKSNTVKAIAAEIAGDELNHVRFLRTGLGGAAVSRPAIDLQNSFTAAAQAAGLITAGQSFDPFADELSFMLGAFIFEDVGVTAYKGAAPLITNKTYLEAAAGILSVEAYHAGTIRSTLFQLGIREPLRKISAARDSLDGIGTDLDQGIGGGPANTANITPTDGYGITYSRTPGQVLNVVYLNSKAVTSGGFFPAGVNGAVNTSDAH